ncbi:MAG: AMP-binding protein, partial [Planctomycetia bacterium]|nr:AMP-binding protein [Planctomycetia bacterium]
TVLGEPAPLFTARQVFFLAGTLTFPVFLYIVWLIPSASLRFFVLLASKTIYRVKVVGLENIPERGGALLVPNHVSWLDGVLLLLTSSRPIRMVAHAKYVTGGWIGRLARVMGVIPIDPASKSSVRRAIETAREALARGELVCVFPEGHITRTGELGPFKRGMLAIAEGTGAPILPVYLDQLWGSIFSYYGGRLFWKWPRRWPYPVTLLFGRPVSASGKVEPIRQAVLELRQQAMEPRMEKHPLPPREFIRVCRERRSAVKVLDSTGQKATGGQLLTRTLVLRRLLLRHVLKEDERYVGVLLPPSLGAVVVNAALPLLGRVAVNLNYTLSKTEMDHCIRECNIRHVLTSRRVIEKMNIEVGAELVYLDDFKDKVTLSDKLVAGAMAYAMPRGMLERKLGVDKIKEDDLLTVIFTSGSTGVPKGVMLTHKNIGSNVAAVQEAVHLRPDDVLLGTLPFFHSFGYTVTMWTVLMLPPKGVFHFSPLDARAVGKLCGQHGVTILVTTPTFLRSYMKRCTPEEFSKLDIVVAGAEKLPRDLIDAFEEKYKIRPVEGYGTTELSPLVSVNIPPHRSASAGETVREGSVGRCVPGVRAKVVHPDTEKELSPDEEGMLLVTGPNVMAGYLNQPEKTAEVMRDGWYVTGDIAKIDRDGFLWITGRLSRFSKIGGEMVPHLRVEEVLSGLVSDGADEVRVAVTAVPCPRKGERLVVVHLPLAKTPDQLCKDLAAAGLPNLFIPSPDSFCQVEKIPLLGSGKLDLKALKQLALEKFAGKL